MSAPTGGTARAAAWVPALAVGLGAGIATAHGLYEVAVAAGTPLPIAGLYPLITDGLALAAYAATTRLTGTGRRYAWAVVVLAAGLSGLAQATYLAGGVDTAPPAVRFGVGAWPAVAAAIVAHLLFLLGTTKPHARPQPALDTPAVQPEPLNTSVQPQPVQPQAVQPKVVQPPPAVQPSNDRPPAPSNGHPANRLDASGVPASKDRDTPRAVDRARSAARRHAAHHGRLPTTRLLSDLAEVSRGTAAAALKHLREQPAPLQVVYDTDDARTQP